MDAQTALVLGGSYGVASKILGPTADYVGKGLQTWAERRVETLKAIFDNAGRKLGARAELPGQVPPRVLKEVLDGGSFADDPIAVDYFGGVLASSRSGTSRDDRSLPIAALLGRLSTYQLRGHFICYSVAQQLLKGTESLNLGMGNERTQHPIYIPINAFATAMDFVPGEPLEEVVMHIFNGFHKEDLIEGAWLVAPLDKIKQQVPGAPQAGVTFSVSATGIALYLAALGFGFPDLNVFLQEDLGAAFDTKIEIPAGSALVKDLKQQPPSASA